MTGLTQAGKAHFATRLGQRFRPTQLRSYQSAAAEEGGNDYREVIDLLNDDEDKIDQSTRDKIRRYFDLTQFDEDQNDEVNIQSEVQSSNTSSPSAHGTKPHRMASWQEVNNFKHRGHLLRRGTTAEIYVDELSDNPDFLLISKVLRSSTTGEIGLQGYPLRRNVGIRYFPQKLNEVFLDIQATFSDPSHYYDQGMIYINIADVIQLRHMELTHENWPKSSYLITDFNNPARSLPKDDDRRIEWKREVKSEGVLVCRHIVIRRYANHIEKKKNRIAETELRKLYEDESPFTPRSEWKLKFKPPRNVFPSRNSRLSTPNTLSPKPYTYGSGFSGWGGDSEAARRVGFLIKTAFDQWNKACEAFGLNHHHANIYNLDASEFNQLPDEGIERLDVWHLSPPCQYWSPMRTGPGKNDAENMAALFSVGDLLKKLKPRFHTQEQTSGILTHHGVFFGYLIHMIVNAGYNVRWKIAHFDQYGLPSSRRRLIIFASQIGEPLPEFPAATHGLEQGLKQPNYIWDAISRIPVDADNHLDTVQDYPSPKEAYDPAITRAPCILTCGPWKNNAVMPYFTGKRPFTLREVAALNGFDHTYRMPEGMRNADIMKMIGNSVPPSAWTHFIGMVHKAATDYDTGIINEAGLSVGPRHESRLPGSNKASTIPRKRQRVEVDLTGDEPEIMQARKKVSRINLIDDE